MFAQVVARWFARHVLITGEVEYIVDNLEGHAQRIAVSLQPIPVGGIADHRAQLTRR